MASSIATSAPLSDQTLRNVIAKVQKQLITMVQNSGGLAIKAGSSALAKTVNTITCVIDGVLVQKAAADCAVLSGATVADGSKNVYVFCVDAAGTFTTLPGTQATTIAGIVWPTIPSNVAVVGYLIVATAAATFVPGTTALDAGTVTATYVNTPFPFDPTLIALA